jgi:hypothetical protein
MEQSQPILGYHQSSLCLKEPSDASYENLVSRQNQTTQNATASLSGLYVFLHLLKQNMFQFSSINSIIMTA